MLPREISYGYPQDCLSRHRRFTVQFGRQLRFIAGVRPVEESDRQRLGPAGGGDRAAGQAERARGRRRAGFDRIRDQVEAYAQFGARHLRRPRRRDREAAVVAAARRSRCPRIAGTTRWRCRRASASSRTSRRPRRRRAADRRLCPRRQGGRRGQPAIRRPLPGGACDRGQGARLDRRAGRDPGDSRPVPAGQQGPADRRPAGRPRPQCGGAEQQGRDRHRRRDRRVAPHADRRAAAQGPHFRGARCAGEERIDRAEAGFVDPAAGRSRAGPGQAAGDHRGMGRRFRPGGVRRPAVDQRQRAGQRPRRRRQRLRRRCQRHRLRHRLEAVDRHAAPDAGRGCRRHRRQAEADQGLARPPGGGRYARGGGAAPGGQQPSSPTR